MFVLNDGKQDGIVNLTISLEPDEVTDSLSRAYFDVAVAEGIHPHGGLDVREACVEKLGEQGAEERFSQLVMEASMPLACDRAFVSMVGQPKFSAADVAREGEGFTFGAQFAYVPEIDLTSYDPVMLDIRKPEVPKGLAESYVSELIAQVGGSATDAWVAENVPGCSTLAELIKRAADEFERRNEADFRDQCAYRATLQMAERLNGEIPAAPLEAAYAETLEQFREAMRQREVNAEEAVQRESDYEKELAEQVRARLAQEIALDAVVRHAGLALTEEDVSRFLHVVAPGNEDGYQLDLLQKGGMYEAKRMALHMKAGDWLVERAVFAGRDEANR